MKVRFLGFSFSTGDGITLESFLKTMSCQECYEFEHGGYKRLLMVRDIKGKDYFAGLLVTIKDNKKFCELKEEGGELKVFVTTIDDDSHLMEFNFFLVNKLTGFGIYQHYHNSCSLNGFGHICRKAYNSEKDLIIKNDINDAGGDTISSTKIKKIRARYKGSLKWEMLVRPEKLEDLINELESIKAFELDFLTLRANEPVFKPLGNIVEKERRKFSFVRDTPVKYLASEIGRVIKKLDLKSGRVFGKDENGIDQILKICDNPDNFGEYDFDDLAAKLNFSIDDFDKTWVVKELLKAARENPHIFEAETND